MQVKPDAEVILTDDFDYDLANGYIEPEKLVDEESAKKVRAAMAVLKEFENALEDNDLIEYH